MTLLADKVVLVTGAARGIGYAHALELAGLGATVIVNDIGADVDGAGTDPQPADRAVAEITATGGRALANHENISDWDGAGRAIGAAITAFGRLDGLVNNAGNMRKGPLAALSQGDLDALAAVHLKGTFACSAWACRHWRDRFAAGDTAGGAIVNTISETMIAALPDYVAYGAMKAGIASLTTAGSREAHRYNVRINAYAPRAFTRMSSRAIGTEGPSPRDARNTSPLVAWLLSDEARHVAGQTFMTVGGGIARVRAWRTGALHRPPDGSVRFSVEEVDRLMGDELFATRFPAIGLVPMPGEEHSGR